MTPAAPPSRRSAKPPSSFLLFLARLSHSFCPPRLLQLCIKALPESFSFEFWGRRIHFETRRFWLRKSSTPLNSCNPANQLDWDRLRTHAPDARRKACISLPAAPFQNSRPSFRRDFLPRLVPRSSASQFPIRISRSTRKAGSGNKYTERHPRDVRVLAPRFREPPFCRAAQPGTNQPKAAFSTHRAFFESSRA